MAVYTRYDPTTMTGADLTTALLGDHAHIDVDTSSIVLVGTNGGINFFGGSPAQLGIGPGVLLTTGTTPNTANTDTDYGTDRGGGPDPSLDAFTFPGSPGAGGPSHDATSIAFNFTVTDPDATCVTFDLEFGSEDFSEFEDTAYTDLAAVFVNGAIIAGENNGDLASVLSAVTPLLPLFRDNSDSSIPIEYDGLTRRITVVAPVVEGVNTIRLAIADRGDALYDSGLLVANLRAGEGLYQGVYVPVVGSKAGDNIVGGALPELITCGTGNDKATGGGAGDQIRGGLGNDKLAGNDGADHVYGETGSDKMAGGADADWLYGDVGSDQLAGGEGADRLYGGADDDAIFGGQDKDLLAGGAGADDLAGGAGKDVFVIASVDESLAAFPDLIEDLESKDRIDVSGIDANTVKDGDQRFELVSAFTGHRGEAALIYDGAENVTRLELDVDGDAAADAVILMSGDQTAVAHFVL